VKRCVTPVDETRRKPPGSLYGFGDLKFGINQAYGASNQYKDAGVKRLL
jgi:hypothetical protein